ncbi:hypothetical protein EHZ19_15715 [Paraburkholderia bannensis]|nr:cytosine permease [Paraburkholderia bannensis]RQM47100.1 hypothetical protein EHZ19_15715 [Paraburkholderia bannensis]
MQEQNSVASAAVREALAGRLPVLVGERIYRSYGSFLWTCCAFSAATWAFLIGGFLPFVGDWRLGVAGYVIGLVIGMSLVALSSGVPSFKYGTEVIDTAKASFGYRGASLPLFSLLATLLGWAYVVEALTSRGAANVVAAIGGGPANGDSHENVVIVVALVTLFVVWAITVKGPKLFERLNGYIGPMHMVITVMMFAILINKFGLHHLWVTQLPDNQLLTHDKTRGLALGVEFGMSNAMTWWPIMGGLTRLVARRSHVIGPSVIGVGLMGAAFVSTVAALAAISIGTYDPTVWMISLAGPVLGSVTMAVVLTANIATLVMFIYLAGVSIQQIKIFTRVRWEPLIAILVAPGIYFAFRTEWLLGEVMSWLSYNGVMFVGVTGVTLADYFLLRKGRLDASHLFAAHGGKYSFWGGVNWVAVAIVCASTYAYLWLYNPVTSASQEPFKYLGASLPVILVAAFAHYVLTRLVVMPLRKGAYVAAAAENISVARAEHDARGGAVTVSL